MKIGAELLDNTEYFNNKMETFFWSINSVYLKTFSPLNWADISITDLSCIVQAGLAWNSFKVLVLNYK